MNYSTKAELIRQHPLSEAAQKYPAHLALQFRDKSITYSDLYIQSRQVAMVLSHRGIQTGQIVALGELSTVEMIISIWACMLGGFITFPLNIRFPKASITAILTDINPAFLISDAPYPDHNAVSFRELIIEAKQMIPGDPPLFNELAAASLLMTSGSSGEVKFVQHSHHNHIESAKGSNQNIQLNSSDRWVLSLPLYHVGGLAILFRTVLSGATLIVPKDKDSILEKINQRGASHLSVVTTQLQRLLREQSGPKILQGVKAILLGGSTIPPALIQESLKHKLPIFVSYGSTEMASQITTTSSQNREAALQNSGKVLPGRELIISHTGEILVKGETLGQGYLKNSKLIDFRDKEGWFHTGDIGYINVQGELTVTGRVDNQFISGGENIQPEHIERLLCNISGILNAIVIPQKDEEFGARPAAFLEIDSEAPDSEEIGKQLRNRLPGYMIPIAYYQLPGKLATDSLKISRKELIKLTYAENKDLHTL